MVAPLYQDEYAKGNALINSFPVGRIPACDSSYTQEGEQIDGKHPAAVDRRRVTLYNWYTSNCVRAGAHIPLLLPDWLECKQPRKRRRLYEWNHPPADRSGAVRDACAHDAAGCCAGCVGLYRAGAHYPERRDAILCAGAAGDHHAGRQRLLGGSEYADRGAACCGGHWPACPHERGGRGRLAAAAGCFRYGRAAGYARSGGRSECAGKCVYRGAGRYDFYAHEPGRGRCGAWRIWLHDAGTGSDRARGDGTGSDRARGDGTRGDRTRGDGTRSDRTRGDGTGNH